MRETELMGQSAGQEDGEGSGPWNRESRELQVAAPTMGKLPETTREKAWGTIWLHESFPWGFGDLEKEILGKDRSSCDSRQ